MAYQVCVGDSCIVIRARWARILVHRLTGRAARFGGTVAIR